MTQLAPPDDESSSDSHRRAGDAENGRPVLAFEPHPASAKVSGGKFWLISSRVVLYSLPMSNESKAKSAFMKPVQPDDALAKIVGANPLPRTELTKKLWEYIKQNKLQNKKVIKADAALETVFNGKKEVDMFELTRLVNTHIVK